MFKYCLLKRFAFIFCFMQTVLGQNSQEKLFIQSIKSIVFKNQTSEIQFPVQKLGEPFELHFDDLNGDERNYYYKIKYFNI